MTTRVTFSPRLRINVRFPRLVGFAVEAIFGPGSIGLLSGFASGAFAAVTVALDGAGAGVETGGGVTVTLAAAGGVLDLTTVFFGAASGDDGAGSEIAILGVEAIGGALTLATTFFGAVSDNDGAGSETALLGAGAIGGVFVLAA